MRSLARDRIGEARVLHRSGRLGAAKAAYAALLETAPDDGDLIGLLGVVALQEGRHADAEGLFRDALRRDCDPRVHLRNLNNYLVLLQRVGRSEDARALVAGALVQWPDGAVPDTAERAAVLSLVEALLLLDEPDKVGDLLGRALPDPGDDGKALVLAGRLMLARDDAAGAAVLLGRAIELDPDDPAVWIALAAARHQGGEAAAGREAIAGFARAAPVFIAPRLDTHKATIATFDEIPGQIDRPDRSVERLHHAVNYPGQARHELADEYQFLSVFADLPPEALPDTFPRIDLVINNMANSELMNAPGRLERALRLVERIGAPVLNHPQAVFETTRQKAAELLHGVPDLRVPRIARYRTDLAEVEAIADDIGGQLGYPVILRKAAAHKSAHSLLNADNQSAVLLGSAAAVRDHLAGAGWREVYAIEYLDLKKPAGYFRKIRAVVIGDEIVVTNGGYFDQWMVSGWRHLEPGIAFYRANPECIADLRRIVGDPQGALGQPAMDALAGIRDRMPLDFFGIDFDVDDRGRVALFEANAAMNFLPKAEVPEDLALPDGPYERVNGAFRALLARRIGGGVMALVVEDRLGQARSLHTAGRLGAAKASYEAMLESDPGDAGVLGLLGVLALQEGRAADAEALFRDALARPSDPRVHLRNVNNYLVLLKQSGRADDARGVVAGDLPDWPRGVAPDGAERETVLSLGEALLTLDQPEKARRLIANAAWDRSDDAAAQSLLGRLSLETGDYAGAAGPLIRASELAPTDCGTLIALGHVQDRLGQADAACQTMERLNRHHALYRSPARADQRARLLVLNPAPARVGQAKASLRSLHFSANYLAQFSEVLQDDYRFLSLYGDLAGSVENAGADGAIRDLPDADVVVNNIVNSERMNVPGRLEIACAVVERIGLPVINHPQAVFATTRQKNAALLRGIPGLRIPRIERYRTDTASIDEIAADIEGRFDYPLILRHTGAHMSADAQLRKVGQVSILVADRAALRGQLTEMAWREFYAVEYVDLRKKAWYFRKIRAFIVDGEITVPIAGFHNSWLVAGARMRPDGIAFYRAHPETVVQCNRIVNDPEAALGSACMRVLEAIRDRIPLDIFGVDFDIDDYGAVVLFEANAAMNVLPHPREPVEIRLPTEPIDRIKAAFHRAVARRMGCAG